MRCPQKLKDIGFSGTGVAEVCEAGCGCWEQNPGPKGALGALNCSAIAVHSTMLV